MQPFLQNSTDVSFAVTPFIEGLTGQRSRAADYSGELRAIYEAVYADGLVARVMRRLRAMR